MRKSIFGVAIFALLGVLLISQSQAPRATRLLEVPLVIQQTKMWCWAASTEMILGYMGKAVTQCEQLQMKLDRDDCCETPVNRRCVRGGWPFFYRFGFDSDSVDAALSWAQLKNEIDNNRPVAFAQKWNLGGGHMMTVVGYAEPDWLYINDPWNYEGEARREEQWQGDLMVITHDEYVQGQTHTHWRDYYNIHKKEVTETTHQVTDVEPEPEPVSEPVASREPAVTADPPVAGGSETEFVSYDKRPEPVGGPAAIRNAFVYPEAFRNSGFAGKAIVNVLVNKNGEVEATRILQSSGHASLDEAAVTALKSVAWRPALYKNKPVNKVWVAVTVPLGRP